MQIDRRLIRHFDWSLFAVILLIPCLSMVVLYSSGFDADAKDVPVEWLAAIFPSPAMVKQGIFFLGGIGAIVIGMSIPPVWLHRVAYVLYVIGILLLIAVLLVGTWSHNARRWLSIGGFNFQPAEMMKLAVILTLSRYLSKSPPRERGYGFRQLIIPAGLVLLPMMLIIKQPDLGTALAIGGVGFLMILFMGIDRRCLIGMVLFVALGAYPAWHYGLHDYQRKRVLNLFDPSADALGSGYHIIQSIIAVGSGAFLGKGFLRGTQTQLEFLPEHSTDFIFSVLAEEWGFVGCVAVLAAYLFFLYRLLRVVGRSREPFSALIAMGVTSLIFVHAIVNIGMVIGILPVVGIPLILFSYGGSSLVSTMFSLGIVLGISMRRLAFIKGR